MLIPQFTMKAIAPIFPAWQLPLALALANARLDNRGGHSAPAYSTERCYPMRVAARSISPWKCHSLADIAAFPGAVRYINIGRTFASGTGRTEHHRCTIPRE